jgi:Trypsin-co-occurring domain 1
MSMATRLLPATVGGVQVLVEAEVPPGTELTASRAELAERAQDSFARAQAVILAVAGETVTTMGELMARAAAPDQIEVTFGLKFSAEGGVIVAKAVGEVSLQVKLAYAHRQQAPA